MKTFKLMRLVSLLGLLSLYGVALADKDITPSIRGIGYLCLIGDHFCEYSYVNDATKVKTTDGDVYLAVGGAYYKSPFEAGVISQFSSLRSIFWSSATNPTQLWELPSADIPSAPLVTRSPIFASAITRDGLNIAARAKYKASSPTIASREAVVVNVNPGDSPAFSSPIFKNTLLGFPVDPISGVPSSTSSAVTISDDGKVAYGFGGLLAFRWEQGISGLLVLPVIPATPIARAASRSGSIVLLTGFNIHQTTYRYNNVLGIATALSPLPGDTDTFGFALTADGKVAIGISVFIDPLVNASNSQLISWSAKKGNKPKALGSPNTSWGVSNFGGITADAKAIIVSYSEVVDPDPITGNPDRYTGYSIIHPYLRNSHGFFRLEDVLSDAGIDISGWVFSFRRYVTDINPLVGVNGVTPDGRLIYGGLPRSTQVLSYPVQFLNPDGSPDLTHDTGYSATFGTQGFVAEVPKNYLKNYKGKKKGDDKDDDD